jgi:hypothetical protein
MGLFQVGKFGGATQFELVRALSAAEIQAISAAATLVRQVAWTTPYHALASTRTQFSESFEQVTTEGSENFETRLNRCATALNELAEQISGHGEEWLSWVTEILGVETVPGAVAQAVSGFGASEAATSAQRLATGDDFELEFIGTDPSDAVVRSADRAFQVQISRWLAEVEKQVVLVMDAGLQAVKEPLDMASAVIMRVSAEAMAGSPVIAPLPTEDGWEATFDPGIIDAGTVRAAQSLSWQARTFASQITQDSADASHDGPLEAGADDPPETADEAGCGGSVESSTEVEAGESPALPAIAADLHRVIDAMVANVDGLVSQWSMRFPLQEFTRALEVERAQAASLVQPLLRAVARESEAADQAGLSSTVQQYPPLPEELAEWSSLVPAERLWTYQSAATVHSLQLYLAALEDAGMPARLQAVQGRAVEIEFDPLRSTALYASARLLAELLEENAGALETLKGRNTVLRNVARETETLSQQLGRSVKISRLLGLPEAQLVYALRLITVLDLKVTDAEAKVIEAARSEAVRYAEGEQASRGVIVMLADGLIQIVSRAQAEVQVSMQQETDGREADPDASEDEMAAPGVDRVPDSGEPL